MSWQHLSISEIYQLLLIRFWPNFLDPIFGGLFWTKESFIPKTFWPKFFLTRFFLPKFFSPNFLDLSFLTQFFSEQRFWVDFTFTWKQQQQQSSLISYNIKWRIYISFTRLWGSYTFNHNLQILTSQLFYHLASCS